jgi:hypothetical protein
MMALDLERVASTHGQSPPAQAARIGVATIRQFEGGATEPRYASLAVLKQALS